MAVTKPARSDSSRDPGTAAQAHPVRAAGTWLRAIPFAAADVPWQDVVAIALGVGAGIAALAIALAAILTQNALLAVFAGVTLALGVASHLVTRQEMHARLAASRRHYFASSPRGLAEMDLALRIVEGNGRLATLLGIAQGDLVGSMLTCYFPADQAEGIVAQFRTLLNGSTSTIESDTLGVRSDRTRVWLHWRATAVRRPSGAFDYFMVTFEDTTEKHAAEQMAQANLAELEKLNHLKSEFTSMVSHEFRTALTGIQGMSELINVGDMEPVDVHDYSGYIFKEAERINRLITDMLDLDRLEAGRMTMRMLPVDLNAIVLDVAGRTQAVCTTHTIATDLDPVEPAVIGDPDRLTQVLTNLISNAIKYSPDGGEILISTRFVGGFAHASVRDHGVGIPPEFVDHLFGRFERYEKNPTKVIGTGLGLAISRQIVEMHAGKIWVERAEGGGSVFRIAIPVAAGARLAPPQIEAAIPVAPRVAA